MKNFINLGDFIMSLDANSPSHIKYQIGIFKPDRYSEKTFAKNKSFEEYINDNIINGVLNKEIHTNKAFSSFQKDIQDNIVSWYKEENIIYYETKMFYYKISYNKELDTIFAVRYTNNEPYIMYTTWIKKEDFIVGKMFLEEKVHLKYEL